MRATGTPSSQALNAGIFCLLIGVIGVLFLTLPKTQFSMEEKRELAKFPELHWANLVSGQWTKGLDDYVADNFIFRWEVTRWARTIRQWRGQTEDGIELIAASSLKNTVTAPAVDHHSAAPTAPAPAVDAHTTSPPPPPPAKAVHPDSTAALPSRQPEQTDTTTAETDARDTTPYQNIESLIIYKNRAIQVFGGSAKSIAPFTAIANRYQQELSPDVRIYCMAIPAGSDFFLPRKVNKGVMREKESIDQLYAGLHPAIVKVHAYEKLASRTEEYIQFRTDHHWTGLGAYYAYTAFAEAAGMLPLALTAFTKKDIPNFLGTLYYKTLSKDLASHPDTVEYYKIPFKTDAQYFPKGLTQGIPTRLYAENAKGGNSYGVFLGSDFPLMKVVSENKTGKKIVVIKDSYGNAFVPYLSSHYEEVYIIDYRYFQGNIKTLIKNNGIQEMLFAHNTFMLNSAYTASRARGFLDSNNATP